MTNMASYHSTLPHSEAHLDEQSALGTIDPSSNLKGQPVYLWSGAADEVVNPLDLADLALKSCLQVKVLYAMVRCMTGVQ